MQGTDKGLAAKWSQWLWDKRRLKPALFVMAFAAVGLAVIISARAASTPGPTGIIVGTAHKCMNVAGNKHANGTQVELYQCLGVASEDWTLQSDGSIRNAGWCLDDASNKRANNNAVRLWTCNGGASQKWAISGSNIKLAGSSYCLNNPGASTKNGNALAIYACSTAASEKWVVPNDKAKPDAAPGAHAALPSGTRHTAKPTVYLDAGQAPDLLPWMKTRLRPILEQWYPVLADYYAYPDYKPYSTYTIRMDPSTPSPAIALTEENVIRVNPAWLRVSNANLAAMPGILLHESTHVIQSNHGKQNGEGWFVEGMASYTTAYIYQSDGADHGGPIGAGQTYLDGYTPAHDMLYYAQNKYDKKLVHEVNVAAWKGAYTASLFTQKTGKTPAKLWTEATGRYISETGKATNGASGKCLDLTNYKTSDGSRSQIIPCSGNEAQKWVMFADVASSASFSIRSLMGPCLQASGTANGSVVQNYGCNSATSQLWHKGSNGSIVNNVSSKCLQPVGGKNVDGALLEVAACNGSAVQKWTMP